MAGASFEVALELWASSLREAKARMRPLFLQERMARSAGLFLDGLLGAERRKTGWIRAEAAGDPCATSCASMRWTRSATRMPCSLWTRRAS
jgi:hypothetical protein